MTETEQKMRNAVTRHLNIRKAIAEKQGMLRRMSAELESLRDSENDSIKEVAQFVGQNITKRCIQVDGETVVLEYRHGYKPENSVLVEVFNKNGDLVRI